MHSCIKPSFNWKTKPISYYRQERENKKMTMQLTLKLTMKLMMTTFSSHICHNFDSKFNSKSKRHSTRSIPSMMVGKIQDYSQSENPNETCPKRKPRRSDLTISHIIKVKAFHFRKIRSWCPKNARWPFQIWLSMWPSKSLNRPWAPNQI